MARPPIRSTASCCAEALFIICELGEPGGTRTHDPLIKSQVLYRLSYGLRAACVGAGPRPVNSHTGGFPAGIPDAPMNPAEGTPPAGRAINMFRSGTVAPGNTILTARNDRDAPRNNCGKLQFPSRRRSSTDGILCWLQHLSVEMLRLLPGTVGGSHALTSGQPAQPFGLRQAGAAAQASVVRSHRAGIAR